MHIVVFGDFWLFGRLFGEIATETHPFSHPDRQKTAGRKIKKKAAFIGLFQQKRPSWMVGATGLEPELQVMHKTHKMLLVK